jgi:hypothetical protein
MEWVTILTTLLPIILQVINKPRDTPEAKAEMLAIGNDLLAVGVAAGMPEFRLAGQYICCVAKGDDERAGKLIAAAEMLDGVMQARAAKSKEA